MNPSRMTIKLSKNGYEKVMRVRTRQIQRVHCQNAHIAKVKKDFFRNQRKQAQGFRQPLPP